MPPPNLLRSLLRAQPRSLARCQPQRRNLVSTVLLSKSYEERTKAELRDEARKRGLPVSGNKATLITRIQTEDNRSARAACAPPAIQSRPASSSAPAGPDTKPESTPVAEAAVQSKPRTLPVLNIYLPDLSQPDTEPPVQIPFVPDFWESSKTKKSEPVEEKTSPKLILVADESTYPGGGPLLNVYQAPADASESHGTSNQPSGSRSAAGGVFLDVASDLGLCEFRFSPKPDPKLEAEMKDLLTYNATAPGEKEYSRKLDQDEIRGIWVLGGILGGSWFLGWLLGPKKRDAAVKSVH